MNKIDSFTAQAILECAKKDTDGAADLYKAICSTYEGGATKEQADWVNNNLGKKVKIKHTSFEGVIESLNESTHGFYNGGRYPAMVRRTDGEVFEYGIDWLILTEE